MAASVRSLPEAKAEDADNPLADKQKAQAETVETVEVEFESRQQISKVLRRNKCKNIVISVPDVVDMIAALNQIAKLCYKARCRRGSPTRQGSQFLRWSAMSSDSSWRATSELCWSSEYDSMHCMMRKSPS
mmetsp:Transcript_65825/g.154050  ORF Transcript_65825/g.154050 Transcript_65825/m.154050 type:complete len:131 (+) Transcript_65825:54-446(+)